MNPNVLALARRFFLTYCNIITPAFKMNWHHVEIARHLDQIAQGRTKRIIVSLPPQHGKTYLISQHFPTFYLGKKPKENIISTSYTQTLAEDSGQQVKSIMQTEEYKTIFPVSITQGTKSKKRFSLEEGGSYYAIGKGGSITGRGAGLIIIDDLIKNEQEARSEKHRNMVWDWYRNTVRTRLRHKGSMIVVQTRWHEKDLIGQLLNDPSEKWEYLSFPAINAKNEALFPELHSLEELLVQKQVMGSLSFQGLYQQEPCLDDGNYIKADWILRYSKKPDVFSNTLITFDLTFKGEKDSDFVVGQYWGISENNYYLLDMMRGQWDFTSTLFQMRSFLNNHTECTNILIEDAANGAAVFSTIKAKVSGVRLWKPQTSKEGRLLAVSPLFESGNVYIPEGEKYDPFISEMLGFPNVAHDDTVDACTMALLNLKNQSKRLLISMGESIY